MKIETLHSMWNSSSACDLDYCEQGEQDPMGVLPSSAVPLAEVSASMATSSDVIHVCVALSVLYGLVRVIQRYGAYVFNEALTPEQRKDRPDDRLVTRIHGAYYDLSSFHHPGGPIAVSLIHRRDGTALFESHHPFVSRGMLTKILSKYEISKKAYLDGCTPLDPRDTGYYDWEGIDEDAFAQELRGHVNDYFRGIAKRKGITLNQAAKATPARWALIISLMACFFGTLPSFINGNWLFLFMSPVLAWVTAVNYVRSSVCVSLLYTIVHYSNSSSAPTRIIETVQWHDGLHFSLSTDWRVNAWLPYLFPYYSSPWLWYHEHVIGHHAYPNVAHKDPDLAHAPQLMREHGSIKWKPTHASQARWHRVLLVWSVALGIGLSLLNDAKANLKSSYNNVVPYSSLSRPRVIAHVLGRCVYVYMLHLWPFFTMPLWKALIWATVPGAMLSVCFMLNTQINHLSEACAHASSPNFYKHQAVTAQNFGNDNLFCYYFSGGLNYQIEHHLFPTVNHCHLPALSPGIKRICHKHGVPYNHATGYCEAFAAHFAHTKSMSVKPPC